jgi:hypothetical protein
MCKPLLELLAGQLISAMFMDNAVKPEDELLSQHRPMFAIFP